MLCHPLVNGRMEAKESPGEQNFQVYFNCLRRGDYGAGIHYLTKISEVNPETILILRMEKSRADFSTGEDGPKRPGNPVQMTQRLSLAPSAKSLRS